MRNHKVRGRRPGWQTGLQVGTATFVAALVVALPAQGVMVRLDARLGLSVIAVITLTGILFDVIGVATAAASETPFHARAARRLPGARQSLWLVRNADRVAAFANDLVGDLAGTVSGAAVVALAARLVVHGELVGAVGVAALAGITVGAKAAGKGYAIAHADEVVARAGRVMAFWQRKAR